MGLVPGSADDEPAAMQVINAANWQLDSQSGMSSRPAAVHLPAAVQPLSRLEHFAWEMPATQEPGSLKVPACEQLSCPLPSQLAQPSRLARRADWSLAARKSAIARW